MKRRAPAAAPEESPRTFVDRTVLELGGDAEALIPILQAIQDRFHYLPEEALRRIGETTHITPASVEGVASFYSQFRRDPAGRRLVTVCHGTACHVKGADLITDTLRRELHLDDSPARSPGELQDRGSVDTDPTGQFTFKKVACLGCCTLAPVVAVDGVIYGHLTPDQAARVLSEVEANSGPGGAHARQSSLRNGRSDGEIRISVDSCCVAGGSMKVRDRIESAVAACGALVRVKPVGCVGMCHQIPVVEVVRPRHPPILYSHVTPDAAEAIVRRHFRARGLLRTAGLGLRTALDNLLTGEREAPLERHSMDVRDAPIWAGSTISPPSTMAS